MSHRRKRALTKTAARMARVLAIVICAMAVLDFAYNAYQKSNCYAENYDSITGNWKPPTSAISEECHLEIARRDQRLRLDAGVSCWRWLCYWAQP